MSVLPCTGCRFLSTIGQSRPICDADAATRGLVKMTPRTNPYTGAIEYDLPQSLRFQLAAYLRVEDMRAATGVDGYIEGACGPDRRLYKPSLWTRIFGPAEP